MLTTFTAVANVGDLEDGQFKLVQPEGADVLLVRVGDDYYAINALCSHAYGFLDEGTLCGYEVECPLHVGKFDVRTGEATQLPAAEPVASYAVQVSDGKILIGPES